MSLKDSKKSGSKSEIEDEIKSHVIVFYVNPYLPAAEFRLIGCKIVYTENIILILSKNRPLELFKRIDVKELVVKSL